MDLFTRARAKITLLYFFLGAVITTIAGYLIYSDILIIIQNVVQTMQNLLITDVDLNQAKSAAIITQAINAQVRRMDISVGGALVFAMVLSAYILAGITLKPVKQEMERQARFMANISHELRTPLSVMKANIEVTLLGADTLTREELVEAAKNNVDEIDRMAKIIEFLMNFSKTEYRVTKLTSAKVNLAKVAKNAMELVKQAAHEHRIRLAMHAEENPVVMGNATVLEEMVLNLLKNAVHYTPDGGEVAVMIEKKYGATLLSVKDTGAGIDKKDIDHIFEAFYRGGNAAGHKKDGNAGLGLAIVKELATLHNATVSLKSEVGKGTTVTVRFPGPFSKWLMVPLPWG